MASNPQAVSMRSLSDEALAMAWSAGDQQAGATLLNRYYARVRNFFEARVGKDCAADLTQAAFLDLARAIRAYTGVRSFRGFVMAISSRTLLGHLRNTYRLRARIDSELIDSDLPRAQREWPQDMLFVHRQYYDDEASHALLSALQKLPKSIQMMFDLYYFQGLNLAKVAEILERPVSRVRIDMHRGRKQLVKHLGEHLRIAR